MRKTHRTAGYVGFSHDQTNFQKPAGQIFLLCFDVIMLTIDSIGSKVKGERFQKRERGIILAKQKEIKTNAMRILESMKIPFRHLTYECDEFVDALQIADMLSLPYEKVFKTLVTVGNSRNYFVFVIPIAQELDLKAAARSVGEKSVEMIPVKEINAVTGYIRGGCTAVGMKKAYVTRIHVSAREQEQIIVSGGRIGSQLELAPEDLARAARAEFADVIRH